MVSSGLLLMTYRWHFIKCNSDRTEITAERTIPASRLSKNTERRLELLKHKA